MHTKQGWFPYLYCSCLRYFSLSQIRERFPRRPWIDVVSKVDLGIVDGALEELEEILDGTPYIKLSIQKQIGITELRTEVLRMLGEVRVVLDAMAAVEQQQNVGS